MEVIPVSSLRDFNNLKERWDDICSRDPHATVFVSWAWTKAWILSSRIPWLVLGVRQGSGSPFAGFLSLGARSPHKLIVGGTPLSDHNGFVCEPRAQEPAIRAIAGFVRSELKWTFLDLKDIFDPRLEIFLEQFSGRGYRIHRQAPTPCPYVDLPGEWETYLQTSLHNKTRAMVRRAEREIASISGFRVEPVNNRNVDEQINAVLALWRQRWGRMQDNNLQVYRTLFETTHQYGCLRAGIMRDGETIIGAYAGFTDHARKAIYAYLYGFNPQYNHIRSPGLAMDTSNIRYAIEHGFGIYDFCRGDERYKFSLGSKLRYNQNVVVERVMLRRNAKTLLRKVRKMGGSLISNHAAEF